MSGLLLDTHVALWWLDDRPIADAAASAIANPATPVHVSMASLWELAIKAALGKVRMDDDLADVLLSEGFVLLDVRRSHVYVVRDLPMLHRDPFDRMLVAQARAERLTLVTRDSTIPSYDVDVLAA